MPDYSEEITEKIVALQALTPEERKYAEVCALYWPAPAGVKVYSSFMYTEHPWWPGLAAAIEAEFGSEIPITLTLIPDGRDPFSDLPRGAFISDDSINLTFSDIDNAFSGLLMTYGEGIRGEKFGFWAATPKVGDPFDLFISLWQGIMRAPKEMSRALVKFSLTAGFRAAQMLVPRRPYATSCPFVFGGLLDSQEEIDAHKGCPYSVHVGGSIGVPGFTDCPRRTKADCVERLATEVYWAGFETRPDAIPNNQTQGPNLLAKAVGNESNLSDPVRVIAGERYVKALSLLAFRIEEDTNHPEDGFGAALFAASEGPLLALWEFRINGQLVGAEHQQQRLGELGQTPTDWSPDVNSYSGTAHVWGRIQGDFRNVQASDFSASARALGAKDLRVYSDPETYVEGYTTNRMWWLLHILAHLRWGYGQDYPRYDIQSAIDTATWCDEVVSITEPNGNTFGGVRSTFNAEVTARAIQQQVKDICTAGRIGLPFEFQGKDVFVPLKVEDVDDPDIPTFTDEGNNPNIVFPDKSALSTLSWSYISDDALTNQWTVNFDDASNGGVDTQLIFGDQRQQLRAGRAWGDRSKRVINKSQAAFGITNEDEAARFGLSLLYLGPLDSGGILNPFSVKFTTWYSHALKVQNYKPIKVVNSKMQAQIAAYFEARGLSPYPGADYTVFRVMKYTRRGNLQVEIEGQMYATLEESPGGLDCEVSTMRPYAYESPFGGLEEDSDGTLVLSGEPTGSYDTKATGAEAVGPSSCAWWAWSQDDYEFTRNVRIYIEDESGDYFFGFQFTEFEGLGVHYGRFTLFSHEGETYVEFWRSADLIIYPSFGLRYSDGVVSAYISEENSTAFADLSHLTPYDVEVPADRPYRLSVSVAGDPEAEGEARAARVYTASNSPAPIPSTFTAPRALTASVNASTGLVHLHWSPPAHHPEMVTGYTLYEADGVTVVMPAALVYNFELTLSPGAYTYKVRATDGVTNSNVVSVTFTVPEPPPSTLQLIDRDSGQVFIDRETGEFVVSRTAP